MHFSRRFFYRLFRFSCERSHSPFRCRSTSIYYRRCTDGLYFRRTRAQKKLQIGSLTKIATASVVLDWADGNQATLIRWLRFRRRRLPGAWKITSAFSAATALRCVIFSTPRLSNRTNIAAYPLAHHVGSQFGIAPAQVTLARN